MPRPRSSRRSSGCSPNRSCAPAISAARRTRPVAAKRSRPHWDEVFKHDLFRKPAATFWDHALMTLRIYGVARTRAFRALWAAEELRLVYEHVQIEIGEAGARRKEFLALNPNGRLPLIIDDSFVLSESLAITLYLAKKYSPGKLYPAGRETKRGSGSGVSGRWPRSTAASISGHCMQSVYRRTNATRHCATKRCKCSLRHLKCSMQQYPKPLICSGRTSPS